MLCFSKHACQYVESRCAMTSPTAASTAAPASPSATGSPATPCQTAEQIVNGRLCAGISITNELTVTILDQDLRADALRVAASRQVSQGGNWVEAPVAAATVQKLEDVILTRARDLRRQASAAR